MVQLMDWMEGLQMKNPKAFRGLYGLSPMNEPAHMRGLYDKSGAAVPVPYQEAYDQAGMKGWANISTTDILQTLAISVEEFRKRPAFGEEDAVDECHWNGFCRYFWWKGRCLSLCRQSKGWSGFCHWSYWNLVEGHHQCRGTTKMGGFGPSQLHCLEPRCQKIWDDEYVGRIWTFVGWDECAIFPTTEKSFRNATATAPGLFGV